MDDRLKQLLILGREHYERREFDHAEHVLQQILERTDRFADVYNMLAVILHDRGDFVGAEGYFARAVELNPNYTEALLNLAVTYNDLGKYEAARQVYARIGEGQPGILDPFARGKIANMHADLAQAYNDADCKPEAIAELKRAVALCPTFADLQLRLGTLYRDIGNLALAREHYEAARDANPSYAPARVLLGVTLLSLGQPDQAIAEWREALSLDPENKSARMYLRMVEDQRNARARESAAPAEPAKEGAEAAAAEQAELATAQEWEVAAAQEWEVAPAQEGKAAPAQGAEGAPAQEGEAAPAREVAEGAPEKEALGAVPAPERAEAAPAKEEAEAVPAPERAEAAPAKEEAEAAPAPEKAEAAPAPEKAEAAPAKVKASPDEGALGG